MNKTTFLTVFVPAISLMMIRCGPPGTKAGIQQIDRTAIDSAALIQAFEQLKTDTRFLSDVALEDEKVFSWNDDGRKIIRGDLNGDGAIDALVFFTIEGRGGGNNADTHYALFLNENDQWNYQTQLDAGGNWAERLTMLDEIKDGKITGNRVGNGNESLPNIPVEFIFKNNALVNTYTALHGTGTGEGIYLRVYEIQTPEDVSVLLTAPLKNYQQLLGEGKLITPSDPPECGTHFDEGTYSELHYPNLLIELNNHTDGACQTVTLKGSGYKLQTDHGTLTEKTTLSELKNALRMNDSEWLDEEEDGSKTVIVPDGEYSDDQIHLLFDKNEELVSVTFFVPC